MGKATKHKGILPKNVAIGTKATRTVSVRGNNRKITWLRIKPGKKHKNLKWKIISNKKA